MFGKNWKTSTAGVALLAAGLGDILHGVFSDVATIKWEADIIAVITGLGLCYAKDGQVTGGTIVQPTSSAAIVEKAQEQKDLGFHGKVPLDPGLPEKP